MRKPEPLRRDSSARPRTLHSWRKECGRCTERRIGGGSFIDLLPAATALQRSRFQEQAQVAAVGQHVERRQHELGHELVGRVGHDGIVALNRRVEQPAEEVALAVEPLVAPVDDVGRYHLVAALLQSLAETAAAAGALPHPVGDVELRGQQVDGLRLGGVVVHRLAFLFRVVARSQRRKHALLVSSPVFHHSVALSDFRTASGCVGFRRCDLGRCRNTPCWSQSL